MFDNYRKLITVAKKVILPTPQSERNELIALVQEKVDFYKPLIEAKFGVELDVKGVKDYSCWASDKVVEFAQKDIVDDEEKLGRSLTAEEKKDYEKAQKFAVLLAGTVEKFKPLNEFDFKFDNGTIYVPFLFMNKFKQAVGSSRLDGLDRAVVHELSHAVWYALGGEHSQKVEKEKFRIWNEGFATYCADEYLVDVYPDDVKVEKKAPAFYSNAKQKVVESIKLGYKLTEIPRRWSTCSLMDELADKLVKGLFDERN